MLFRTRPNRPELDATKVPTPIDIAWAAGIFEGEGTVRLCGRGKRSLAAAVPQKDPEFLYVLRDWFGGSVGGPSRRNPCYHWDICGDRARLFIAQIYGHLYSRRRGQVQIANALDFLRGESPVGVTLDSLKSRMSSFYEEHNATTWRGSNKSAIRRDNYRNRKASKIVAIA